MKTKHSIMKTGEYRLDRGYVKHSMVREIVTLWTTMNIMKAEHSMNIVIKNVPDKLNG